MSKQLAATLFILLIVAGFSACNKPDAKTPETEQEQTDTTASSSEAPKLDIATQPLTLPESDATAKEVCQRFLSLLARNERRLAEQLLTRKASKITLDAGLELEALGGPESTIEVGAAVYATSRAKVAQVPCTVSENDGSKQSLLWMMRRGESGWRIAGLIVETGESQEFLSLENKADVLAIKASQGDSAESEVRLVSATDDE